MDLDAKNMVTFALLMADKTDGYFDPTVAKRLTELWYWLTLKYEWNTSDYGDYRDIEMVWDQVRLHWDILLEFGWVGKWYLIDVIKQILEDWLSEKQYHLSFSHSAWLMDSTDSKTDNVSFSKAELNDIRYLINFGWDMYGWGTWKVWLESPFALDEVIGTLVLDSSFLACSAWTRRKWGRHHHLLDPKTWESSHEVIASYIEWDSGILVDSYATALCVMPWEIAVNTLQKTPEISGVIIRHDWTLFHKIGENVELFT